MTKKIIYSLFFILVFTACGTSGLMNKTKQLQLGMSRQEATALLGNNYRVVAARQTPEGGLEVLRYGPDILDTSIYMLNFIDGRLVEWYEEVPPPIQELPHRHERGTKSN